MRSCQFSTMLALFIACLLAPATAAAETSSEIQTERRTVSFSDCANWYRNEFPWFFSYLPDAAEPESDDLCRAFHGDLMDIPEFRPLDIPAYLDTPAYHCRHYPEFLLRERYGSSQNSQLAFPHFIECLTSYVEWDQSLRACAKSNLDLYTNDFRDCVHEVERKRDVYPPNGNPVSMIDMTIGAYQLDEGLHFRWAQRMLVADPTVICHTTHKSSLRFMRCQVAPK